MSRKLTIVPHSGLANRMRAIAGAYVLAMQSQRKLEILWPVTRDLGAPIEVLFDMKPLNAKWRNITSRQYCTIKLPGRSTSTCRAYRACGAR